MRICFKMRKFFFILQYIVVFLHSETNDYEQDSICIDHRGNAHIVCRVVFDPGFFLYIILSML